MARHILTLVLAVAIAVVPVQGGSRAWESPIAYDHTTHVTLFGDPARLMSENSTVSGGNSTTRGGNSSIAHINSKRWMTIKPGDEEAQERLWPNGVISYCFDTATYFHNGETKTTRKILYDDLREARDLWLQAGLTEGFDRKELSDSDCADASKRPYYLKIFYSDAGKMATTLGVPALRNNGVGPTMTLSDSDMGMLNIVANYAHEMGHAWGMHHEHQNQRFWGAPYSEAGGKFFGANNWNCRNLKDYNTVYARILREENNIASIADKRMALACQTRVAAAKEQFSAYDYLPVVDEPVLASTKDPDWDSIMLYPSGTGASGTIDNGVDNRQVILTKPNGAKIAVKLRPSNRDVEGLKKLYGYKTSNSWTSLGDKASKFADKFKNIRKKDPDSGCH